MTDYTVAAVDEALALLLRIAQRPGVGVSELARLSGNTKARTFRLLYTLEQRGFIRRNGEPPTYYLGNKALYLGVSAQDQSAFVATARKHLRELGRACNENVQVRVREGLESLCIVRWDSLQPDRVHRDVGNRRPLHAGASGKVLLAYAPEEAREALLSSQLEKLTEHTLLQRSRLLHELARVRTQGYAVSSGEVSEGAAAVAAPLRDADNTVIAALSVAGPVSRFAGERLSTLIELVVQHAAALSKELALASLASSTH